MLTLYYICARLLCPFFVGMVNYAVTLKCHNEEHLERQSQQNIITFTPSALTVYKRAVLELVLCVSDWVCYLNIMFYRLCQF